ncbi:MAG: PEPxxWA-CTERM sorting domain-containing protein [Pseudomonadota bacterium]
MTMVALSALAALSATAAQGAVLVSNDFNDGVQGWRVADAVSGFRYTASTTGGRLQTGDVAPYTFFEASSAYLGDKSAAIGGTISFDMAAVNGADPLGFSPLVLRTNGRDIFAKPTFVPGVGVNRFSITLTASNFYQNSQYVPGGPAPAAISDAEFAAVMADLRGLYIYADWKSGQSDLTTMDNVVLASADVAPVPEPAVWALMILGFGAAGSALRRRQAALA